MASRPRSEPRGSAQVRTGADRKRHRTRPAGDRKRPGSPRTRLFVALDLPPEARAAIGAWRDRALGGRRELRPAAAETLHVTLCFLGWRPERDIARVAELTASTCAELPAPTLRARALTPLPPRRPRLFAVDLEDPGGACTAAQAAVADALSGARLFEPERRPFWPHLTVARVKRGARTAVPDAPPPPDTPFQAARVTLYRSTLRPQGALYEPLAHTSLRS